MFFWFEVKGFRGEILAVTASDTLKKTQTIAGLLCEL